MTELDQFAIHFLCHVVEAEKRKSDEGMREAYDLAQKMIKAGEVRRKEMSESARLLTRLGQRDFQRSVVAAVKNAERNGEFR
jgi:hypothetical protein